jgi:hypothetical protein
VSDKRVRSKPGIGSFSCICARPSKVKGYCFPEFLQKWTVSSSSNESKVGRLKTNSPCSLDATRDTPCNPLLYNPDVNCWFCSATQTCVACFVASRIRTSPPVTRRFQPLASQQVNLPYRRALRPAQDLLGIKHGPIAT